MNQLLYTLRTVICYRNYRITIHTNTNSTKNHVLHFSKFQ